MIGGPVLVALMELEPPWLIDGPLHVLSRSQSGPGERGDKSRPKKAGEDEGGGQLRPLTSPLDRHSMCYSLKVSVHGVVSPF